MAAANPPESPHTVLRRIADNAEFVVDETQQEPAKWNVQEVKTRMNAVKTDVDTVGTAVTTLTTEQQRLAQLVESVQTAVGQPVAKPRSRWREFWLDLLRLAIVWGLAVACLNSGDAGLGWFVVRLALGYMLFVLMAAAIRSDQTYAIRHEGFRQRLYDLMPSRLVAPVFVAGLFCALWWGFAAIYQPALDAPKALDVSFLALATFSEPDDRLGLASWIRWQFASAILLLICIFSMLINRISEF